MPDKIRKKSAIRLSAAAIIFLSICCFAVNAAAVTAYWYTSEPGDWVGDGLSDSYTSDNATINVSGTAAALTISVRNSEDWWSIDLSAPKGENLRPGTYYNAERSTFRTGRAPGLDVSGNSHGCNTVWGSFLINQIATNTAGAITMLDASFTQNCGAKTAPALRGWIRFNSEPLFYSYSSDAGDFVGMGESNYYQGANSIFTLTGNANSINYNVSGKRNGWAVSIEAPTGKQLQAGTTYETTRFSDATHAGLSASGNSHGCNRSSGTLKINAITFDELGKVTGLKASFVQHCEGAAAALRGTIQFHK